jgi:hypothetical protein
LLLVFQHCFFSVDAAGVNPDIDEVMRRPRKQMPQVEIALLVLSGGLIAFSATVVKHLILVNHFTRLLAFEAVGQSILFLTRILEPDKYLLEASKQGAVFKKEVLVSRLESLVNSISQRKNLDSCFQ